MLELKDYLLADQDNDDQIVIKSEVEEYELATKILFIDKPIAIFQHNSDGDPAVFFLCKINTALQEGSNGSMVDFCWIEEKNTLELPTVNFLKLSRELGNRVKHLIES